MFLEGQKARVGLLRPVTSGWPEACRHRPNQMVGTGSSLCVKPFVLRLAMGEQGRDTHAGLVPGRCEGSSALGSSVITDLNLGRMRGENN